MERHEFRIQGSAAEPYLITFVLDGGHLLALCDCPAGENGQWCKHRLGILLDDPAICATLDSAAVAMIRAALPGTKLESALVDVVAAEAALAEAQKNAKAAKKRLSAVMLGRG